MLTVSPLTLSYDGSRVLSFPGLALQAGERCLLMGPSGSGKTSLLSIIAGLLRPDAGSVAVAGRDLFSLSPRALDGLRGRSFGFVFQTMHLLPTLTVRQNIALAAAMPGLAQEEGRLDALLQRLGLADKAQRRPDGLSVGEAQRAAIARAVYHRPKIILADEPTSALDDGNAQIVADLLIQQAEENSAALLIATHDRRIADRFTNILTLDTMKAAA